jgi:uncharacterized protein (TIGR00288 family)
MNNHPRATAVQDFSNGTDVPVAVLVDCDNVPPEILPYALRMAAQFGRVALRRGYGNHATLANRWQEALVRLAFTPHLQYQYASGKNTADIALALDALEAMFDHRAETFCLVTSDSDFAYLCRKLRERGARVCIVGESKTPEALRNASDQFFEWSAAEPDPEANGDSAEKAPAKKETAKRKSGKAEASKESSKEANKESAKESSKASAKQRPRFVAEAVSLLASESSEGRVGLGPLGQYLKRTDPAFSPKTYGHSGLLDMVKTYDLLELYQEAGGNWSVGLTDSKAS